MQVFEMNLSYFYTIQKPLSLSYISATDMKSLIIIDKAGPSSCAV